MREKGKSRRDISYNYVLKVVFVVVLLLLFLIPLSMIRLIVNERQSRSLEAEEEIVSLWGGRQTISGPLIAVPYKKIIKEQTDKGETKREVLSHFFITPDQLDIKAGMQSEIRARGIYEIPVYRSEISLNGTFDKPDISGLHINSSDIYWDDARITVELPDMRSIQAGTRMLWEDESLELASGVGLAGIYANSLQSSLSNDWQNKDSNIFRVDLKLRGAGSLSFIPFGKETDVYLKSDWPAPSFDGAFLPTTREIDEEGFTSSWSVHSLARSFPEIWKQNEIDNWTVLNSSFGVNLFNPVDLYTKVERSVKYGMLFIILPFIAFFMFEVFSKKRIHILQYLMVGAANTIFYLLLLSLSEHIGFNIAYLLGAVVTSILIIFYSSAVLATRRQGLAMIPIMVSLYTFLYAILQSEDYALLIGSLGLFVMVALVMILTRKVDWHKLNRQGPDGRNTDPHKIGNGPEINDADPGMTGTNELM